MLKECCYVLYNETSTNDDSCDQKDGSLEFAESMVSNNSTIGYFPHETGQLSSYPHPYHPSSDTFTPWLIHQFRTWGTSPVTKNSTSGYRWNSPYGEVICCLIETKTLLSYCFERLQGSITP